ncbi:MAG: TIR domain-containing protein [Acidobacteria bacterium]|nr:TIR domain-containing protein [Acidobacteriota bacterium]
MTSTERYDVFISYRRKESADLAQYLKHALTDRGLKVFLDVTGLGPGRFDTALLETIARTPNFLVILAPGSLDRCREPDDWLAAEIARALDTKRRIVPVTTPGFVFPSPEDLPKEIRELGRYQCVDYDYRFSDASIDRLFGMLQVPGRPAGRTRRRVVAVAAAIGVAIAGGMLWVSSKLPTEVPTSAGRAAVRAMNYSIVVQKFRNGEPYEQPFRLAREMVFESDYRIRLLASSPQEGYLYIVNEGPALRQGLPDYNVLFPTPTSNNGSPRIAAGQEVQIPEKSWFVFDAEQGTEKVWLVWSGGPVGELESIKAVANPEQQGVIEDARQTRSVQALLASGAASAPAIARDEMLKQTTIRSNANVLVHVVNLEHQ